MHPSILDLANRCDQIIHCGDIGNADVLTQLEERASLSAVRGNNDIEALWAEEEHPALTQVPWEREIVLPGGTLGVCHGHQEPSVPRRHSYLRTAFPQCRAVAYGHSHQLVIDEEVPDCRVLNPGAAGRSRTHGGPSCLILKATEKEWLVESFRFAW